jgi:hypothetical protein
VGLKKKIAIFETNKIFINNNFRLKDRPMVLTITYLGKEWLSRTQPLSALYRNVFK